MNIFVDTNIIIDLLSNRAPFGEVSRQLFKLSERKKLKIFCNSHSVATTHYILRQKHEESTVREKILSLLNYMKVVEVNEEIIKKALKSKHKDFEDAIQILCAHQIKNLDGIITRNLKDFSTSEIRVFSPDEALKYINDTLKNK